jgi:hypothetical protein
VIPVVDARRDDAVRESVAANSKRFFDSSPEEKERFVG